MDIKCFLEDVCNEIKYEPIKKSISDELELHIQEIKENYIDDGMNELEAEEKAVKQMGEAKKIGKELNKIHKTKLDWKLIILICILIIFGIIVELFKQRNISNIIIYTFLGIAISIGIYFCNYKKIKDFSEIIYLIATVIVLLPTIGISTTIEGVIHCELLGITFMPCTVAVPMYIIAFAGFVKECCVQNNSIIKIPISNKQLIIKNNLIKTILFSIFSLLLIAKIPSLTNAIILASIYLVIATVAIIQNSKNKIKKLFKLYVVVFILMIVVFFYLIGNPYIMNRVVSSFKPEEDSQASGYIGMLQKEIMQNAKNIGQADTEIISNNEFIINNNSNYTFIYLVGKVGTILSSILVLIIILTSIKLIFNAKIIREQYGRFLIIGMGILYILQSSMNVLMNINLGIKVDVNLPFVTYGGIDFIVNIVSIAIVLSVYRKKDIALYEESEGENNDR